MREAYLTGHEPVFTRSGPLSRKEQQLLEQAQEPSNKARYSYHDCAVHGVFSVDNDLGLTEVGCPRRRKECRVREVFDPAGYVEYYSMDNAKYQPDPAPQVGPGKLTPEQNRQLDEVLALANGPARDDETLRAEMERILGCKVKGSAQEMLDALREGLAGLPTAAPITRISQCFDPNATPTPDEAPSDEDEDDGPQLTDIEHYASLMFEPAEVCTILGLDPGEASTPEFQLEYRRGQLMQLAQQRATIFKHAKNGSAPAQLMAADLIKHAAIAAAAND